MPIVEIEYVRKAVDELVLDDCIRTRTASDAGWEIIDAMPGASSVAVAVGSCVEVDARVDEEDEEYYDEDEEYYDEDEEEVPVYQPIVKSDGKSFRDVVVANSHTRPSRAAASSAVTNDYSKPKRVWKPQIEIAKVSRQRVDRQYGASQVVDAYDPDDEGIWDVINAQLDNKLSNAASRSRSIVMLTPAQTARKAARIAAK